jgi:hypothetical protein
MAALRLHLLLRYVGRGNVLRQDKHGKADEKLPDTHNVV